MKRLMIGFAAAFLGFAPLAGGQASARALPQRIEAPSLVDQAACTVRRIRTVRPNGRVVYRTVRRCTPRVYRPAPRYNYYPRRHVERCQVVRQRVVRPNGRIVYRTVRRCR